MIPKTDAPGALRVSAANPRYFEDSLTGKIVYLTGTHTWNNFQDTSRTAPFDYPKYLDFLQRHHMNFIRLWVWEHPRWAPWSSEDSLVHGPLPYARTGPGTAADGLPRFDLDTWNEEYFGRLAQRVSQAGQRGIYVGVMLFSGCSIGNKGWPANDTTTGLPVRNPWDSHPFHRANNINGVDGDPEGTGQGWEMRSVARTDLLQRHRVFIRKVVDTLNGLGNVLYEILNEDPCDTRAWQYEMLRCLHSYQSSKPCRHPAGMTVAWGQPNEALFDSPADWISPYYDEDRAVDPLTADGGKVWLADTDHVFPNVGATMDFVWKAFLRGANVISMDNRKAGEAWEYFRKKAGGNVENYEPTRTSSLYEGDFTATPGDLAQMHTALYAARMDLARATPHSELCSTGYCLAAVGSHYLIYQPDEGAFTVDLSAAAGKLSAQWFHPLTGETTHGGTATPARGAVFAPPYAPAVLYLAREVER